MPKKTKRTAIEICVILIGILVAIIIITTSKLVNMYGIYMYQNETNKLDIGDIDKPSFVEVILAYDKELPTDIKVVNQDDRQIISEVVENLETKTVTIKFDTGDYDKHIYLTLQPQSNTQITYTKTLNPSRKYITAHIETSIVNDEKILKISGEYTYNNDPITLSVKIDGDGMSKYVYSEKKDNPIENVRINITKELAEDQLDKIRTVTVIFAQENEYVETSKTTIDIDNWLNFNEPDIEAITNTATGTDANMQSEKEKE